MMDSKIAMVAVWSYGLAGVLAALLTLYLASGWRAGGRSRAMFLALSLCALWGMLGLAFALTGQVLFLAGSLLADMLRFGGWYLFLLVLMKPEPVDGASSPTATGWLGGFAHEAAQITKHILEHKHIVVHEKQPAARAVLKGVLVADAVAVDIIGKA